MSNPIWNYRESVDTDRSRDVITHDQAASTTAMPSGSQSTFVERTDIVGYDVEAADGGLGSIDESSHEAGASYVVVDTGWWIFGKKRLIPAGVIEAVDHVDERVFVGLTKQEIKSAPDFDETHRHDRAGYDEYYGRFGQ